MHKIGILSFNLEWNPKYGMNKEEHVVAFRQNRRKQLGTIFDEARVRKLTHLFFPGWSFLYTEREFEKEIYKNDIEFIEKKSQGLNVLVEFFNVQKKIGDSFFYAFHDGKRLAWEARQLFITPADPLESHEELAVKVSTGERIIDLDGLKILVLVCGEMNMLVNSNKKGMAVTQFRNPNFGRFPVAIRDLDHDVVFNPLHTRWDLPGRVYKRWQWLSLGKKGKRICISTTNCHLNDSGTAPITVWQNGKLKLKKQKNEMNFEKDYEIIQC